MAGTHATVQLMKDLSPCDLMLMGFGVSCRGRMQRVGGRRTCGPPPPRREAGLGSAWGGPGHAQRSACSIRELPVPAQPPSQVSCKDSFTKDIQDPRLFADRPRAPLRCPRHMTLSQPRLLPGRGHVTGPA